MKRDMDLIRDFMMKIEEGEVLFEFLSYETAAALGIATDSGLSTKEADHQQHNFQLIVDEGLIEVYSAGGGAYCVEKITWAGHDFLDAVRDPTVWARTKEGALAAGGWTFELIVDIAKGIAKKKFEAWSGVQL